MAAYLIHGLVVALFAGLVARAFWVDGPFAWSAGLVYVGYDTFLLGFTAVQTWRLRRARPRRVGDAARPTLGVLIAAYNEASVLPATLAALAAQTDRPDRVFVADDGSGDDTGAVVRESAAALGLEVGWLRLPRGGKARALNAALLACETDLVMTVDADTLLAPGAVAAMRGAFARDPGLVAATGVLRPICGAGVAAQMFQWFQTYEYVRNFLSRYAWMRADGLLLISGAFAGFRRAPVVEVGGFDTDCLVEDYELIHRLRRYSAQAGLGWHTAVLGEAVATTEAPGDVRAFLRQRRRWFGGFLQTQYWYLEMVGNPAFGRLGTAMLPVKAADTLQPLYGLLAAGLLGFYLVTGRFWILVPAGAVTLGKVGVDLAFHLWSVRLYRRWVGRGAGVSYGMAFLAAVTEPLLFQPVRHLGAALGWVVFFSGSRRWGKQRRVALAGIAAG